VLARLARGRALSRAEHPRLLRAPSARAGRGLLARCGARGGGAAAHEPRRGGRHLGEEVPRARVTRRGPRGLSARVPARADRPAFYALRRGRLGDVVTLLHPPYTAWHLSYVALGAAAAPRLHLDRLLWALAAFALAV